MLRALLLDMDNTLCDTHRAVDAAKIQFARHVGQCFSKETSLDGGAFASAFVTGIYREWSDSQRGAYLPIIERQGEEAFRKQLIKDLLAEQHINTVTDALANDLLQVFESERLAAFDFYPGIADFLGRIRDKLTLVVITNGPEFSQLPKIAAVNLEDYVDHIIVGGQESEQKPARSIFEKALQLANCQAEEAIHIGDSFSADIVGASNSNIKTIWVRHEQKPDAVSTIRACYTVDHPREIPALVEQIAG